MLVVPRDANDLSARRPREDSYPIGVLWLCEAESRRNLAACCAPDQAGDLRRAVDSSKTGPGEYVVEVDAAIVRATSHSNESALPRTKCDSFDRGVERPLLFRPSCIDTEDPPVSWLYSPLLCSVGAEMDVERRLIGMIIVFLFE